MEWYAQDSWKVSRRLNIDLGIRFYSAPPAHDDRFNITTFDPASYDAKTAAVLIRPGLDAAGKRVGVDPRTGQIFPLPYIGLFVPGSGTYAPGMVVGGKGFTGGLYETPPVSVAPRVGFSYDPFGTGKTAIRGGWGMFYDRPQGNVYSGTNGQPPVAYTPTLHFGNLDTFLQSQGAVGPGTVNAPQVGRQSLPTVMNFSLGVQREVGFHTMVDVAYVGSLGRHLLYVRDMNPIPMYARFDPANTDPTTRSPLQDNFLRPYLGMSTINVRGFGATSNYHSLQVAVNRRMSRGMQYGVAYTFSKTLGVANADFDGTSQYFPTRRRNYGPLSYDIRHVLVINYAWDLPNPAKSLGQSGAEHGAGKLAGGRHHLVPLRHAVPSGLQHQRRRGDHGLERRRAHERHREPAPAEERAHLLPQLQDGSVRPPGGARFRQRRRGHPAQPRHQQLGHQRLQAHPLRGGRGPLLPVARRVLQCLEPHPVLGHGHHRALQPRGPADQRQLRRIQRRPRRAQGSTVAAADVLIWGDRKKV